MDITEYGFTEEEAKRYKVLVSKKMGSFQAQSENTGGEIEYKGMPYYPEFAKDGVDVDFFSTKSEIEEYQDFQRRIEEAFISGI